MGVFDWYPYSNTQELNLDWVLKTIKQLITEYNGLQQEIQETIDYVNNFETHVDEIISEQIATALANYNSRLVMLEREITDLQNQINSITETDLSAIYEKLSDLQIQISRLGHIMDDKVLALEELMHEYKHDIDTIIDGKTDELKQFIIDEVTTLDRLDIVNPITGVLENIQYVINDIYAIVSKSFGITAEQYDNLKLTAREFDTEFITASDYDTRGYFMLVMKLTFALVRSPFTGEMTSFNEVLDRLTELHKCALTAQEYDDLQLTAEVYDYFQLTAWMYDWFSYKVARPVTAFNYDSLKLTASAYDALMITAEMYSRGMRSLVSTELQRCDSACGNYFILANQITDMQIQLNNMWTEVEAVQPVKVSKGVSYVGVCEQGQTSSEVKIPLLDDDAIVSITAGRAVYPESIEVQPRIGVIVTWNADATANDSLAYVVNVSNKQATI